MDWDFYSGSYRQLGDAQPHVGATVVDSLSYLFALHQCLLRMALAS